MAIGQELGARQPAQVKQHLTRREAAQAAEAAAAADVVTAATCTVCSDAQPTRNRQVPHCEMQSGVTKSPPTSPRPHTACSSSWQHQSALQS